MNIVKKTIELSDGRIIEIETGKLAKQADGSVVVKMGGTMLLATVTCAKDAKEDVDFMPLQVDYKEKYASAGRFPGGFMKREGKASDYEILIARLVDRALRPLFPEDFHAEVFVNVTSSLQRRISSLTHSQVSLHHQHSLSATFLSRDLFQRYALHASAASSRSTLTSARWLTQTSTSSLPLHTTTS